jgi:hypothetical protein
LSTAGKLKLSPKDYLKYYYEKESKQDICILDLDATALIFEYFNNGNLIIYGNTNYFIDDI